MSETVETPSAATNGVAPSSPPAPAAPELQLPEGTLQLPAAVVGMLQRLLQEDRRTQDILYAFLQGKGDTGPYSLVLPVALLVRPREA